MPSKMALLNYNNCHPEKCENGICAAALACPHRLFKQDDAYEIPMPDPSVCRGCADCVRACPLKAVQITTI